MRNTILTQHAEVRLSERSKLSAEQLIQLLDNNVWIPLGAGNDEHKIKRLVYSSPDHGWLIVVQDIADGCKRRLKSAAGS